MRFSKIGNTEKRLERRFVFRPPIHRAMTLDVTLAFIPPSVLADKQEESKARVLGRNKFDMLADLEQQARDLEQAWYEILAERVVRMDGLTMRKIYSLIAVDEDVVRSAGVDLDAEIEINPGDPNELDAETRKKWECPDDVTSKGQLARANLVYLIGHCAVFRNFVQETVQDVSHFQGHGIEDERKN